MFQGFTDETFEFFMAIRYNNNREFFHENHDWYVRALREPCLALAGALGPAVRALCPELETRPEKVVARINRDLRFSRDKSPYRDYIWLAFRRPGADRNSAMGAYFDLGTEGASYGVGIYDENRPLMNALRRQLRVAPEAFARALPREGEFVPHIQSFKRKPLPEGLPDALAPWYPAKGFYMEKELTDFELVKSPALAEEISAGFGKLTPLFRYIETLTPENGDEYIG